MKTIVQKFGGSSLASAELREIAASRVLETRARGVAPVVVCSAIGRAPDPYATDSLLELVGPARNGPNRDLLIACGELIGAAVFAELLGSLGARAQAMTGAQAGIVSDDGFGDARIVRVDPTNVIAAIERGIIPVVAGFQGVTARGATTTLGRGGSDLTAIALGRALGSEAVEIFTDVSGVMTGDPTRIVGAHTIDRVEYEEMVELAGEGAKVMHAKAAEYAHVSQTPYVIKGLRTNFGTTIDDGALPDSARPVTGVASRRGVAFVRIVRGDAADAGARSTDEVALFGRLARRDVSIDMVNVNGAGVFFIVDGRRLDEVQAELRDLGILAQVRTECAKLSIVGAGMRGTPGVIYRVVDVLTQSGIEIIHSTDSSITIAVLVPEGDGVRAEQALHDHFRLGRPASGGELQKEAIA
jgi:aspartate kinase